jgi:GT2 family glycosyltransferase
MKTVSVNIVTYNSSAYIRQCLEYVYKQSYRKFLVTIIDNCSSDNTIFICSRFPVHIIQNTTNIGYAAAHNQGIRLTHGAFILTLNPDVFLSPDFLHYMVSELERDKHIGSACGSLLRIEDPSDASNVIDGAGLFMRKNRRQGLLYEGKSTFTMPEQKEIFGPDGAAAFYRRKMLEDIAIDKEIFDEDFFMHKEDVDIAWRAQRAGWKSLYVLNATARHIRTFRSGRRQTVPPALQKMGVRNRYLLLLKNDTVKYVLRDILYILIYEMGILCYIALFEKQSFRAYKEALALWGRMIQKGTSYNEDGQTLM